MTNETFKRCRVVKSNRKFLYISIQFYVRYHNYTDVEICLLRVKFIKTVIKSKEYIMMIHVYCVFVSKELEKLNHRQVRKYV